MRVISQDKTIDINYESHTFCIDKCENDPEYYDINAFNSNSVSDFHFIMASYKGLEAAKQALLGLSNAFHNRLLITNPTGWQCITDEVKAEKDTLFEPIKIDILPDNIVYQFPEEEDQIH